MENQLTQKAKSFFDLHHSDSMLILPNIWEPVGALLLQEIGYKAVATASAAMAFTNGVLDGEKITLDELIPQIAKIAKSVEIPVSVDFESGFAENNEQLAKNIEALIDIGVVGINIEDSDKKNHSLISAEKQISKIKTIKEVAQKREIPFFINARTDIYIYKKEKSPESKLKESIERGLAYKEAGADCFYPIVMKNLEDIQATVESLKMPVNILTLPGIPDLQTLEDIGVARVSLGPSLLKYAVKAMKSLAEQLQNKKGLEEITQNPITSDYLEALLMKVQ
ncbi:MAG: isocitrate lyase/phosphoenolpyruvate mutase family protein [Bacteroidetes bacterium]|nr:isocitrate lyase/phosphoenolpyruvate mutase family protein [Bacteroidota bacterium]